MNYRTWQLKQANPAAEQALMPACGALLARVLAARGVAAPQQAEQLLAERAPLSDPFLLRDMDKAVERILQAIAEEEPIVIFGDYDVDGVCATALLYECLTSLGAHVRCKLPSREGDGYGLSRSALQKLAEKGYTLVVTVDNGISAVEEAACAKELGIDLVITDHHLPPETLPEAVAVVDPRRADDESPFQELCGAGVAFKLCAALEECDPAELLEPYGELVALGTSADVMPLVGENRTIVQEGLALLQDTMRPGLHALLEAAGYAGKPVTAETVSYGLAPRINAAGRMGDAAIALKLLLCTEEEQATGIAARLVEINTERQHTEQEVQKQAEQTLAADPARLSDRVLVVAGEGWHSGVIGIVAARLTERYARPVIVLSTTEGEGRGSGRAPGEFDLHSAIAACSDLLIRFGGHVAAAGLQIEEENIPAFRRAINDWAAKIDPRPKPMPLELDAAVEIAELTVPAVASLQRLAPFGRGNMQPVLMLQGATVDALAPLGAEGRHTRVRLRQGTATCYVSQFGVAPQEFPYPAGTVVDAAIEVSLYEGRNGAMVSAQLRAIRPAGLGDEVPQQAALFAAFRAGANLTEQEAALLLPERADTVALYRSIRSGSVFANDLQPVFARQGPNRTGKVLASLQALQELQLVERQGAYWAAAAVTEKRDLTSAPVLQKLAQLTAPRL